MSPDFPQRISTQTAQAQGNHGYLAPEHREKR